MLVSYNKRPFDTCGDERANLMKHRWSVLQKNTWYWVFRCRLCLQQKTYTIWTQRLKSLQRKGISRWRNFWAAFRFRTCCLRLTDGTKQRRVRWTFPWKAATFLQRQDDRLSKKARVFSMLLAACVAKGNEQLKRLQSKPRPRCHEKRFQRWDVSGLAKKRKSPPLKTAATLIFSKK